MSEVKFAVIKGNASEIKSVLLRSKAGSGVDASDRIDDVKEIEKLAAASGAAIVVSGKTDIISSAEKAVLIKNGSELMSAITGTGCMLSVIIAAFAAANPSDIFAAAAAATALIAIAGERAAERMGAGDGGGSFRAYLLDALRTTSYEHIKERIQYEIK